MSIVYCPWPLVPMTFCLFRAHHLIAEQSVELWCLLGIEWGSPPLSWLPWARGGDPNPIPPSHCLLPGQELGP